MRGQSFHRSLKMVFLFFFSFFLILRLLVYLVVRESESVLSSCGIVADSANSTIMWYVSSSAVAGAVVRVVRVAFPYFVSFSFHLVMNYMYFVLPLGFCSHTIFLCGIQFYYCRAIKIKIIMEILSPSTEPNRVERWHLSAVWADMMSLSHTVAQTIRYPNFKAELFYYSFNYFYEIFHSSDCFDCSVLSQNWKLCAQMQSWNLICERNLFLSSVAKAHGRFGNLFILKYLISTILPFNLYDCF